MKKRIIRVLILAAFILVLMPRSASAAGYEGRKLSDGSVEVVNTETGEVLADLTVRLGDINEEIAVSGKWVYFTAAVTNYTDYSFASSFYAYNFKTGEQKYLGALPKDFGFYDVNEAYNGSVYLTGWNPSDNTGLYRWNIRKGTLKKAAKAGYRSRYKQYIICDSTKVHGSYARYPVYVYNTKKGKAKTAEKKIGAYSRTGKYLYMAVQNKDTYPSLTKTAYRIVRYNIKTGQKKTLKKSLKAYMIRKITSKYIWHYKQIYDQELITTYYRTKISSGTMKKISKAAFEKALK